MNHQINKIISKIIYLQKILDGLIDTLSINTMVEDFEWPKLICFEFCNTFLCAYIPICKFY